MSERRPKPSRWARLKHAFSVESDRGPLTESEIALLDRFAQFVVRRRMTTPAILFLESVKPMNYVGSQTMLFFQPVVRMLFAGVEYTQLQEILERRESIEVLIQRIEQAEARQEARRSQRPKDEVYEEQ